MYLKNATFWDQSQWIQDGGDYHRDTDRVGRSFFPRWRRCSVWRHEIKDGGEEKGGWAGLSPTAGMIVDLVMICGKWHMTWPSTIPSERAKEHYQQHALQHDAHKNMQHNLASFTKFPSGGHVASMSLLWIVISKSSKSCFYFSNLSHLLAMCIWESDYDQCQWNIPWNLVFNPWRTQMINPPLNNDPTFLYI